jgi:hypothetical protein
MRKLAETLEENFAELLDDESESKKGRMHKTSIKAQQRKELLTELENSPVDDELAEFIELIGKIKPTCRGECQRRIRPCIFVSCKYNLYLDVNPVTGSIKFNFPDKEPWELTESCALDIADKGGITLEEIGELMNLTRERIRQLEAMVIEKIKKEDGTRALLDLDM